MQYVYILQSEKDGYLYTGCTLDLKKRLILHNAKKCLLPLNALRCNLYIMKRLSTQKMHLGVNNISKHNGVEIIYERR